MDNQQSVNNVIDLGTWLGRKQAFGLISGKCSAAEAQCLRTLRDEKRYLEIGMSWEQFCKEKIGISRQTAERVIRNLEEFGPKYFELAAVLRIPADQYRRIAPAVTDRGVVCGGETIEISAENSSRLAQAIESLRESSAEPDADAPEDLEVFRSLSRARKAFTEGMKSYTRALELTSPAADRAAIRREIEKIRALLEVNLG